ncbi:hypothetical protein Cgig2_023810 [Carnegiea gigantea]|uniref:Uncharacterized protein n=1 Tax=Carnegiea gigantea TaxID=171969 RepID=A0A9Q1JFB6_9CARY|nr:hypothetical protein Cgig2_023810 [Carnegiea gigantea]
MLQYARLLIEVSLEGTYPDYVEFVNDFNVVVKQMVKFEWMPVKCGHCQMLEYKEQECRKKGTTRMEWRVARPTINQNDQQQEQDQTDGFTRVQSRTSARSIMVFKHWKEKKVKGIKKGWQGGHPPMDSVVSWNIRGLNWPNKQEDVKVFLRLNKVGLVGLLKTKVKVETVNTMANSLSTNRKFFITYVYGFNQETNRQQMWEDLTGIAQGMNEAWCILGDFKSVLQKKDSIGGADVLDSEISKFSKWIDVCELQKMRSSRPYFSWTNKITWSRIDRVNYLPNRLSDHTPLHIILPSCPRPKHEFTFCDMWTKDPHYMDLVKAKMKLLQEDSRLGQLKALLNKLKPALRKLNKDKYAYLYEQQARAREDMSHVEDAELRKRYVSILSSVLLLIKQQCKVE